MTNTCNELTLQDIGNEDLINCLTSRHERYARTENPEYMDSARGFREELLRRLNGNAI